MTSKFGGVPVETNQESQFGGVPVNPYSNQPQSEWEPLVNSGQPGWMDSIRDIDGGKVIENAPGSAMGLVEAAVMPVTHPIETAKAAKDGFVGLVEKSLASQMETWVKLAGNVMGRGGEVEDFEVQTPNWDKLTSYYRESYGSPEGFKSAVETDPFGVLADGVSAVYGTAGALRGVQKGIASALPDDLPNSMVEETAKFPAAKLSNDDVKELTEFMLENDIRFSSDGIKLLDEVIDSTGKVIDEMIKRADSGKTIPKSELNAVLRRMKRETVGKSALAGQDRKIIQKIIDGWEDEIRVSGKTDFTLPQLQKFKQTTYGKVNWDSSSNKKAVRNEALKRQALDAKTRLEQEVPGIKEANKRQGTALELKPMLDKSVKRIDRNNKIGMDYLVSTGSGGMFGAGLDAALMTTLGIPPGLLTGVGTTLGAGKAVMGQPGNKRSMAQAIYDARRIDPNLVDGPLAKAMAIYLARENQAAIENQ